MESVAKKTNMKKAKNVILFIGDGMGYPSQTAGRILAGGEEYDTAIDKMPWSGSVKTYNIGKIFGLEKSSKGSYRFQIKIIKLRTQQEPQRHIYVVSRRISTQLV